MRIDVVTLFPEFFDGPAATGLIGRALAAGRAKLGTVDPRAFTRDRHRTVDDTPYGGGGGMVLKPEPIVAAIREAQARGGGPGAGPVVLMSPQGRPLAQSDLVRWAAGVHLVLVAGRYEGFDERIRRHVDDEVSIGDFVLTGGEYAALAIVDGVVRLLPGTLGNKDCPEQDSFSEGLAGLLEYPHYTRPAEFEGETVPDVLQSGHHQRLTEWRQAMSLVRTRVRRPDLLRGRGLTAAEALVLADVPSPPTLIALPGRAVDAGTLEVAAAYDVAQVFAVAEGAADASALRRAVDALPIARYPVRSPPTKKRRRSPSDVEIDLAARVSVVDGWSALPTEWEGRRVVRLGARRRPPDDAVYEDPARFAVRVADGPVPCLTVGAPSAERYLPVIRGGTRGNRLPLPVVLGVYLDRLVAER